MAINKIVYDGNPLIDLTGDTVTPETLAEGATAHNKSGEQIIGAMKGGSPVEIEQFWKYENGQNIIDMFAVSFGGVVCYYCVIAAPDGIQGNIDQDDGAFTDLREYGEKFVPSATLDGSPADMENFSAAFVTKCGVNNDIQIALIFLYQSGINLTSIMISSGSRDDSYTAVPGVVFLGMCKSQEAQPSARFTAQASEPIPGINLKEVYDAVYPVNSIKMWYDNEDHSGFLGFKWERRLAGRFPVGINTGDGDFNTIGKQGGEKTHALTVSEIPPEIGSDKLISGGMKEWNVQGHEGTGQPHNNLPPYEVIAPWRRIS